MKTCACGNELVDSIDEFGDIRNPVCITCWLTPAKPKAEKEIKVEDKITELEEELSECKGQISYHEDEISNLEDEISEIRIKIRELQDVKTIPVLDQKNKLKSWVSGEPIRDEGK